MAHIPPDAISCSFDGDTPRLYKKKEDIITHMLQYDNLKENLYIHIMRIVRTTFWNSFHAAVRNSLRRDNRSLPLLIAYTIEKEIPTIFSGP